MTICYSCSIPLNNNKLYSECVTCDEGIIHILGKSILGNICNLCDIKIKNSMRKCDCGRDGGYYKFVYNIKDNIEDELMHNLLINKIDN